MALFGLISEFTVNDNKEVLDLTATVVIIVDIFLEFGIPFLAALAAA